MSRQTFKKKITSEEQINKINPKNIELINQFLRAKGRTCSDATIKTYKSDLYIFFCWLVDHGNDFYIEVKKRVVSEFFNFIQDELQCHGRRFSHYRSVLSELSSYCLKVYEDDELGNFHNFVKDIIEVPTKVAIREKTVLTKDDVNFLLKYLTEQERYQEACLLACGVFSGMRISELEQIRVSWIDENKLAYNDLFYRTPTMRTKGRGKEGKQIDRLIIHDLFKPYFDTWVKYRKERLKKMDVEDHDYLFINRSGKPASQDVIRGYTDKWGKLIGKDLYPHSMRHCFVTFLQTEYNCSSDFIKTLVHWSDTSLVDLYSDRNEDDIEWEEIENMKKIFNKEG